MTDKRFSRDGITLAYDDTGSGPFVGYAHGLFISRRMEAWLRLADLAAVRQAHRFVQYDARGHGVSGGRPVADDYRWDRLAGDLLALLDELDQHEPVDFIGASMGTGTLLWAAVSAPRRFRRLVLTLPSTAWQTRPAQAKQYLTLAEVAETQGKDEVTALLSSAPPPPVFAERFAELAESPEPPPAALPDNPAELLPWVLRGAAASDYPDPDAVAGLTHPTLILAEVGDPGHPESTAERLHELIPDSEVRFARTLADMRGWGRLIADFLA